MLPTTKPVSTSNGFLSWLVGANTCELDGGAVRRPKVGADDVLALSTSNCPVDTIRELREQLVKLRAQVAETDKVSMAQVLRRFAELNSKLHTVCSQPLEDELPMREPDSLSYIMETLQVVAQLADEAQIQEGLEQAGDERAALETIKKHYAYLTQIITAYNLVFNGMDSDLMGEDDDDIEVDDSVEKLDKIVQADRLAARPLLEVS